MSLDSTSPGAGSADPAPNDLLQTELLVEYRDDGVAVVCSLHQLQLAQQYAQRLVGLAAGRVHFDAAAASIDPGITTALYQTGLVPT